MEIFSTVLESRNRLMTAHTVENPRGELIMKKRPVVSTFLQRWHTHAFGVIVLTDFRSFLDVSVYTCDLFQSDVFQIEDCAGCFYQSALFLTTSRLWLVGPETDEPIWYSQISRIRRRDSVVIVSASWSCTLQGYQCDPIVQNTMVGHT